MEENKKIFKIVSNFKSPELEYCMYTWSAKYIAASLYDAYAMYDKEIEKRFGDKTYTYSTSAYEIKETNGKKEKILLSSYEF